MFASYKSVFSVPGAAAFSMAGLVMRAPLAMFPLGIVLFVSARTGEYGWAGVLTGVYTLSNGIFSPLVGRLVDRLGQSAVIPPALVIHLVGGASTLVIAYLDAPIWTLAFPVAVFGAAYLNVGSLVRARWSYLLKGRPELSTAFSLEAVLDEMLFVLGPILVTTLALLDASIGMILAFVLVTAGSMLLRARKDSEPPRHEPGHARPPSPIRLRVVQALAIAMAFVGGVFGSAEVGMVAFADENGARAYSGLLLACFGLGSMGCGLVYGSRRWRKSLAARFAVQGAVFGALQPLFMLAPNVPAVAFLALIVGLGIAPTLITGFGLTERVVPSRSLTEGLSWVGTGLSVGYASGSAIVGLVVDHAGARAGFLVPVCSGIGVAVTTLWTWRLALRASPPDDGAGNDHAASLTSSAATQPA
jgi:MFS family permease